MNVTCLAFTFQLVIKAECFSLVSVENIIKKCRALVSHANQSTNFYVELYKQEEMQMGVTNRLNLIQDVPTR